MSKLTKLHLINDDDLDVQVKHESIKKISAKELVFGVLSIKLCTIIQILQEFDPFAWEKWLTVTNTVQEQGQRANSQELYQNESTDKNPDIKLWHLTDNVLCYKGRWYIPSSFLY